MGEEAGENLGLEQIKMKGRPMWGPDAAVNWFAYETARKTEREWEGK